MSSPEIVVICGSVQDPERIRQAAEWLWGQGYLVYAPTFRPHIPRVVLDAEHRKLIDASDEVLVVLKANGTIGKSTMAELAYAAGNTRIKRIRFWPDEPDAIQAAIARATPAIHHHFDRQENAS